MKFQEQMKQHTTIGERSPTHWHFYDAHGQQVNIASSKGQREFLYKRALKNREYIRGKVCHNLTCPAQQERKERIS